MTDVSDILTDEQRAEIEQAAEEAEAEKERKRKQAARDRTKYGNELPDLEGND